MELFHGPTLAFKDFQRRAKADVDPYRGRQAGDHLTAAGDTGVKWRTLFYGLPNVKVVILYPARQISPLQEKLLFLLWVATLKPSPLW